MLVDLLWCELGVDVVLDCMGVYGNWEYGEVYIVVGVKKVFFFYLGSNDFDVIVVFGVNQN